MSFILQKSMDNWREMGQMNKLKALFASQSQGFGKTFLGQHFGDFMVKDLKRAGSGVKKLLRSPKYAHLSDHLMALTTTRSLVIPIDKLFSGCVSLEEAVVVEVVSQLSGKYPDEVLEEVRERKIHFCRLCDELLAHNKALIIVLDDVTDLVASEGTVQLSWLRSVAQHTNTREEKTKAVMILLKNLVESVSGKPGALLYMTGRAPEITYQLLKTLRSSPLLAHAVLFDGLELEHIREILMLTTFESGEIKLYQAIGLADEKEAAELARWALVHTGGVPRVITCAFNELIDSQCLASTARSSGQSVWDMLSKVAIQDELYRAVKGSVPHGIGPNWTELSSVGGWSAALTASALDKVLDTARGRDTVACGMLVKVAEDKHVTAVDLLSVLGVPFKRTATGDMTVQLGAWSIRAMLEAKTVGLTEKEVLEQLKWTSEVTKEAVELGRHSSESDGFGYGRDCSGELQALVKFALG
jgi:hypothetical protein